MLEWIGWVVANLTVAAVAVYSAGPTYPKQRAPNRDLIGS
jgi:hypothetical protein